MFDIPESFCFVTCTQCHWNFLENTSDMFSIVTSPRGGFSVKGIPTPCPTCNCEHKSVVDIDVNSKEAYDALIEQKNWKKRNHQLLLPEEQDEVLERNYHGIQLEFLL